MGWSLLMIHVLASLCFAVTVAVRLSQPHCQEKCGNVTIPYPFGIGSNCSANSSFNVICQNSTPFISSIKMVALNISLYGTVIVKQPVSPMDCSRHQNTASLPISLGGSPFSISARYNLLAVIGCKNSVWLRVNESTTEGGCTALCDANSANTSCNGVNCCQATIPRRLKELNYTYKTTEASDDRYCGYVFPVDKKWLREDYKNYKGSLVYNFSNPTDLDFRYTPPLVLEWEFGELKGFSNVTCTYADDYCLSYPDDYGNRDFYHSSNYSSSYCRRRNANDFCRLYPDDYLCLNENDPRVSAEDLGGYYSSAGSFFRRYYHGEYVYQSSTKYCSCPSGYEGNPYLPEGCGDINECSSSDPTLNSCLISNDTICINSKGSYGCHWDYSDYHNRTHLKMAFISIGSALGGLILLLGAGKSTKAIRKRIKANRQRKFFKRNGGLLLEQQLSATKNGLQKTKLFSSKELTQATDHYNETRVLGRGGQGTVYKGMLTDGRIVAVKKSKKVEEGDLEVFINEVVILSQVNHRNVVKLLGCCLETEVPLLVYEFIPNGTLFQHIHDPSEEFPLSWEMRMRIAREVAGALAYLHSAASAPIYHRDIKSTNILLDDKYRAKVSDFGTSRSVAIDQTHLTTRVLGTFGYLDPEYFQSSQFTEKSDVYSFGVVIVELLTGEKAISSIRAEVGRSLATHFLHSMEENQLFDILDPSVLKEGKREEIAGIAGLARRCLHLNGKRRPTMKEVAIELEGIRMLKEDGSTSGPNQYNNIEWNAVEVAESYDFSCISAGNMHLDTTTPYSPEADRPLLDGP